MTRRRALIVQHLDPEGPARIGVALHTAGVEVDVVRVDRGEPVPTHLTGWSALVVMGGPMSAGSDQGFPTRRDELTLLRRALDEQIPTLGVCLGAQLLAVAAGAAIHRLPEPEIGWGTVDLSPDTDTDPLFAALPSPLAVLHWHGETFDLPPAASCLASSVACTNQAYRVGPAAWGLQFHVEVDTGTVAAFADAFPGDAAIAGGAEALLAATPAPQSPAAVAQSQLIARFAALTARAQP
jgi:GMP synthase-like glutamine amidotransferase